MPYKFKKDAAPKFRTADGMVYVTAENLDNEVLLHLLGEMGSELVESITPSEAAEAEAEAKAKAEAEAAKAEAEAKAKPKA